MKKIFAAMPLILTIVGGSLILFFAGRLIWQLPDISRQLIAGATLLLYFYWLRWESHISVGELKKSTEHKDYHTMELAAVAKLTTLGAAFLGGTVVHLYLALPGIAIMWWGIRLRQYAVIALGNQYSHRLRIPEQGIIEEGPYNSIRHPAYLGTFIAHIGFVMVYFNKWSVLSVFILWGAAVLIRTILEDRMLMEVPEYRVYAQRVKYKLFRSIW